MENVFTLLNSISESAQTSSSTPYTGPVVWDILSSKVAICVYIVILLISVISLILSTMLTESRVPQYVERGGKEVEEDKKQKNQEKPRR